jgi:hypothetical protein
VGPDPSVKGLNFFSAGDQALLRTLQHGEFNIHGWRRADLVARLELAPSAIPDSHFKIPHLWPPKLLQAGRRNYRCFVGFMSG